MRATRRIDDEDGHGHAYGKFSRLLVSDYHVYHEGQTRELNTRSLPVSLYHVYREDTTT